MQEAMEANRESLLSTPSGLFLSNDSSLLSDYLQQHAQMPGKRLIHHSTPLILSPCKRLFRASTQREEAEASEPSWFSGLKETSSSANSIPGPSFTTVKKSLDSFIARECSSQTLSELDCDRGDSGLMYRTTLSSLSCIESIECEESCADATTRIHTNRDSLSLSRLSESKEVNALADYHGRVYTNNKQPLHTCDHRSATHNMVNVNARVSADSKQAFHLGDLSKNLMPSNHSASPNSMTGFDLLVNAAMQVEFLDNQNMRTSNASFSSAKKTDVTGNACNREMRYACPLQLNSPILKKRVVRRARNAFSKRTGKDLLHRLGISSPATNTTKKLMSVAEKDGNCINSLKATHMQQQINAIQYVRRKSSKTLPGRVTSCDGSVLNTTRDGSKNGSNKEDLQIPLTGASDVCKQQVKGVQTENQHKLKQQKRMQELPKAQPVDPALKQLGNPMQLEFCENHEDAVGKEKAASFPGRIDYGGEETTPEANEETVACIKFGGSGMRVKIRPVRLPSQAQMEAREVEDTKGSRITQRREQLWEHSEIPKSTTDLTKVMMSYSSENEQLQASESDLLIGSTLVSSQESNKLEISEHVIQRNITIRKRKQLPIEEEHMGYSKLTESMQSDFSNNPSSNPIVRSKRGRSQVLPSKFADSVLQPWKRAYRKRS